MEKIVYQPIGVIRSKFLQKEGMPIQAALSKSAGRVEILPEYQSGLKDLDGFSHIILVYHFHLSKGYSLLSKPFLDNEEHGVFAIRAPKRPNPIGISIVRLEKIDKNILYVKGLDVIDRTLLLDIKPYVPRFDVMADAKDGWLKGNRSHGSDGRFS
jgi:tRNA-Thr(GGU) m(6)t(6)A37 methyltransferase TsaA